MKYLLVIAFACLGVQELMAQFVPKATFPANLKYQSTTNPISFQPSQGATMNIQRFVSAVQETEPKTPLLVELGYISAMELTFAGMSYLASRDHWAGPVAAGGFDLFMGYAGIQNALHQDAMLNQVGYVALSAGFLAKALYNFKFGKDHSAKDRFKVNFIGYNVLVFSGYYLDSL